MSVNVSSERQDIRNVESDSDETEHKVPIRTLDLHPSVSQAPDRKAAIHLIISQMPPPTEWPVADGSVAPLLVVEDKNQWTSATLRVKALGLPITRNYRDAIDVRRQGIMNTNAPNVVPRTTGNSVRQAAKKGPKRGSDAIAKAQQPDVQSKTVGVGRYRAPY